MDSMELGSSSSVNQDDDEEEDDENQDDKLLYFKGRKTAINRPYQGAISNGVTGVGARNGHGNGVRIKIPSTTAVALNMYSNKRSFDDYPPPLNRHYKGSRDGNLGGGMKRRENMENNDSHLAAIHRLGDGFVKMERMKMDMARELESMRMKMEIKRTEMIIQSHQRLVDSFANTVMEKDKENAHTRILNKSFMLQF